MMLERSFASMVSQSCAYQRFTASSRSRRAGSAGAGRSSPTLRTSKWAERVTPRARSASDSHERSPPATNELEAEYAAVYDEPLPAD